MKQKLLEILNTSNPIQETLRVCQKAHLKNYYMAGGAITQTIWNWKLGASILEGIKDIDVIYFNKDEHEATEKTHESFLNKHTHHVIPIDVKNQAFVHQWYPQKYGRKITPYTSTEDGLLSWLPAFAIGVRKTTVDDYEVFAPYGLDDAFAMIIRPNKKMITESSYQSMIAKYTKRWPQLTIFAW